MGLEVEIRSFISKEKHDELLDYFKKNSDFIKDDYQETFYFDTKEDLRIQRSRFHSKIWMKKGKIHDDHREEIEVKFSRDDFERLERLFSVLGYNVQIKWFRKRHQFDWDGIKVCLDYTKGYGYIIELEKICSDEKKDTVLEKLKERLSSLNIELTPRETFERKFQHYKENWRTLTGNI